MTLPSPDSAKAISLLQTLRATHGPSALAFWTSPNMILTLSGARAYSDGVFWSDSKQHLKSWDAEIAEMLETLRNRSTLAWSAHETHSTYSANGYETCDLIFSDGLEYVLASTDLVELKAGEALEHIKRAKTLDPLLECLLTHLYKNPAVSGFSTENLQHVATGILLGYPDHAIVEAVKIWQKNARLEEPMIEARISGSQYYSCPQPVYYYPRSAAGDPSITAHEDLWSQILISYYNSEFHASLEADRAYVAKTAEIGNLVA